MPEIIPVLSSDKIADIVTELAAKISSDYRGNKIIIVCVLKGAFIFLADLVRKLKIPVEVEFIRISSYGAGTSSSEKISLKMDMTADVKDKNVIIVEDIIDSGLTLEYLIDYVRSLRPKSLKVCAMINKLERRKADVKIDYAGHTVEKGFLVGYGLDYAEQYRNLPDICQLNLANEDVQ